MDLKPLLLDPEYEVKRDALYFHFPHYYSTSTPVSAICEGSWKLLRYYEDERLELFDLENDPSETKNVATRYPEKTEALVGKLQNWLKESESNFPTENPNPKKK